MTSFSGLHQPQHLDQLYQREISSASGILQDWCNAGVRLEEGHPSAVLQCQPPMIRRVKVLGTKRELPASELSRSSER